MLKVANNNDIKTKHEMDGKINILFLCNYLMVLY